MMINKWKLAEIIDLEYFSTLDHLDDDHWDADFHLRERELFLKLQEQGVLQSESHQDCLGGWLEQRRASEQAESGFAPGCRLEEVLELFRWLLIACGLLLGVVTGFSYFAYGGKTPINVVSFFILFILPQLALVFVVIFRSVLARIFGRQRLMLQGLMINFFQRFADVVKKPGFHNLGSKQLNSFNLLFARKNRRIFFPPLFVVAQLFGLFFNIGLITIIIFKVATADLAFGWQTTLQVGAEGLSSVVEFVAKPWSWLFPGELASPSLSQIEGSRIILKEGIYHLATENLTSWWPFLLLSLIFYGFLPRLILLFVGLIGQGQQHRRFLMQRRFRAITRRMRTPLVTSQASDEESSEKFQRVMWNNKQLSVTQAKGEKEPCITLIPEEIFDLLSSEELEYLLLPHGFQVKEKKVLELESPADPEVFRKLEMDVEYIVVLVEAWMPPIQEHLQFLKELSGQFDTKTNLIFCLLGKPGKMRRVTSPTSQQAMLWQEKLYDCCDPENVILPPKKDEEQQGAG